MATDNALCCAICFQPLLPLLTSVDPSEAVEALLCSHVFHQERIEKERALTAANEVEFRCPVCKLTTHDMNQSEIKARDEFGSEVVEVPDAGEAEAAGTERRLVENVSEVPTESYEEVPLAAPAPAQKLENRGTMDGLTSDQKRSRAWIRKIHMKQYSATGVVRMFNSRNAGSPTRRKGFGAARVAGLNASCFANLWARGRLRIGACSAQISSERFSRIARRTSQMQVAQLER